MSSFATSGDGGGSDDDANRIVDLGESEGEGSEVVVEDSAEEDESEVEDDDHGDAEEEDEGEGEDEEEGDEGDASDDGEGDDASRDDNEDGDLPPGVEDHMEEAGQCVLTARNNFFEETAGFNYKGKFGEYHIRAYKHTGENDELGYQWPVAFVANDKHWVNAAMWVKSDEGYELISIWAYNAKYEFSAQYYLEDYNNDDLAPFFDSDYRVYEHIITDDEAIQHFSCSDAPEVVEDFFCPALDILSEKEMEALRANDPPAAGKRQKV